MVGAARVLRWCILHVINMIPIRAMGVGTDPWGLGTVRTPRHARVLVARGCANFPDYAVHVRSLFGCRITAVFLDRATTTRICPILEPIRRAALKP